MVLKLHRYPAGLIKTQVAWLHKQGLRFSRPRVGPKICISNKFPDADDDADSQTTLRKLLLLRTMAFCFCYENYSRKKKRKKEKACMGFWVWISLRPPGAWLYRNRTFSLSCMGRDWKQFRFTSGSQWRSPEQLLSGLRGDDKAKGKRQEPSWPPDPLGFAIFKRSLLVILFKKKWTTLEIICIECALIPNTCNYITNTYAEPNQREARAISALEKLRIREDGRHVKKKEVI